MAEALAILIPTGLVALWPAAVAARKGRSRLGWWLFGLLLLIVAIPAAYIASDIRRRCPHCIQPVHDQANVCPHCHRSIVPLSGPAAIVQRST